MAKACGYKQMIIARVFSLSSGDLDLIIVVIIVRILTGGTVRGYGVFA
jgi:hypothetical protein